MSGFWQGTIRKNKPIDFNIKIEKSKLDNMFAKLERTIKNNGKILIFGDYDVDGISSTAFTYEFVKSFAKYQYGKSPSEVQIDYIIPSRFGSYGIDFDQYVSTYKQKYDYIIILDNGSHESFYGKLKEDDREKVTIVDHHPNGDFSKKDYVINPNATGDLEISTGYLLQKIFLAARKRYEEYAKKMKPYHFLDLAAMSMISDMANLNSPSVRKEIVFGLKLINMRKRPLYKEVFKNPYKKLTITDVSFNLIPLLNSAGRLSEDPTFTVDLLTKRKPDEKWYKNYLELVELNKLRKDILAYYLKDYRTRGLDSEMEDKSIIIYILNEEDGKYSGYNVIGVNGLIAGELNKFYNKDAIVISGHPYQNYLAGSGRGANVKRQLEKIVQYCKEGTIEFGGHNQALGIKVHDIDDFKNGVRLYLENEKEFIQSLQEQKKYYISDKIYDLKEYAMLCKIYSDMTEEGFNIKFNDPFFVKVRAEIVGYKEYSRDYMRLMLGNSFDDEIETLNVLTKKSDEIDYKSLDEQVFSMEVTPDIEYGRDNEFGNENIIKTQVNLYKNVDHDAEETEEMRCAIKNRL